MRHSVVRMENGAANCAVPQKSIYSIMSAIKILIIKLASQSKPMAAIITRIANNIFVTPFVYSILQGTYDLYYSTFGDNSQE